MPENKKPETEVHANQEAFARISDEWPKVLTSRIGATRASIDRYEVYFGVPQIDLARGDINDVTEIDEQCKERYGLDLNGLLEMGVRNISTKPAFNDCFNRDSVTRHHWSGNGEPIDFHVNHSDLQEKADEYKANQRKTSSKAKEGAEIAKLAKANNMSLEDIRRMIASYKEEEEVE